MSTQNQKFMWRILRLRVAIGYLLFAGWCGLGWYALPASENVWIALLVTFGPLYFSVLASKMIMKWYVDAKMYRGLLVFDTLTALTVPGAYEILQEAQKRITVEYATQIMQDPEYFQSQIVPELKDNPEVIAAAINRIREE